MVNHHQLDVPARTGDGGDPLGALGAAVGAVKRRGRRLTGGLDHPLVLIRRQGVHQDQLAVHFAQAGQPPGHDLLPGHLQGEIIHLANRLGHVLGDADTEGALAHAGASRQDVKAVLHHAAAQQLVQSLDACPDVGRAALVDLSPVVQKSVHLLLGSKQLTLQSLAASRHGCVQLGQHLILRRLVRQSRQAVLQGCFQFPPPGRPSHDVGVHLHIGCRGCDLHQLGQIRPQGFLVCQPLFLGHLAHRQAVDGLAVPVHGADHPEQLLVESHGEIRLPQDGRHAPDASAVDQQGAKHRLFRLDTGKITHTHPPPGRR